MGLRENIDMEPVSALPIRELIQVLPDSTVRQVLAKMREKHLGCVVVVNEYGAPLGQFTERLLIRLLIDGDGNLDQPVSNLMIDVRGCVKQSDPIRKVIDYMQDTGLRFVCVTDDQGKRPIGLTGQKGVMEYIADHFPRAVKSQLMESKLYMDEREGA